MSAITRRTFLQVSSGALGVCSGWSSGGRWRVPEPAAPRTQPARVFMVLFGTAPSKDDTDLEPESNEEIVRRLRERVPRGGFRGPRSDQGRPRWTWSSPRLRSCRARATTESSSTVARSDYDLIRTGLPTINVAVLNDFMNIPFPLYSRTGCIARHARPLAVLGRRGRSRERMFRDLVEKMKLIWAIKRMRKRAYPHGHRLAVRQRHVRRRPQEHAGQLQRDDPGGHRRDLWHAGDQDRHPGSR